jgi:iron complex transport system substrate-binding protein
MIMRAFSSRLPALLAAAIVAAACAACGSAPASSGSAGKATAGFPVTLRAANGAVHIKSRPANVMSLSPTVTEMLYAIGAGREVKEVDDDSNYPPQAPRTKLSGYTPNVEAIVAYKPSLVIVSYDATSLTKSLAPFKIPVLYLPAPVGLAGVWSEFDELGRATGHLAQAEREVTDLRHEVKQVVAAEPHHAKPLTYYYELDQTYYSVTSDTFIGKLLGLLGMKSIADSAKGAAASDGYPQLSAEFIVKANPDYIILADTICCHQSAATVAARPGWSALRAVKEHRIIPLNDNIASRWGPRIVILLRDVETAIARDGS